MIHQSECLFLMFLLGTLVMSCIFLLVRFELLQYFVYFRLSRGWPHAGSGDNDRNSFDGQNLRNYVGKIWHYPCSYWAAQWWRFHGFLFNIFCLTCAECVRAWVHTYIHMHVHMYVYVYTHNVYIYTYSKHTYVDHVIDLFAQTFRSKLWCFHNSAASSQIPFLKLGRYKISSFRYSIVYLLYFLCNYKGFILPQISTVSKRMMRFLLSLSSWGNFTLQWLRLFMCQDESTGR